MNKLTMEALKTTLPLIPGINGKDEYLNSAVLVLLMLIDEEYHFVFEKRAALIRQGGEICFPGGKFDPAQDEGYRETALRETAEELGIPADKLEIIGALDTVIGSMGVVVDAFLGTMNIDSVADLNMNTAEVAKVFTVPVAYFVNNEPEVYRVNLTAQPSYTNQEGVEVVTFPARELGLPERYSRPWGQAMSKVFVYRVAGETIWGITARLIKDVVARIRSTLD